MKMGGKADAKFAADAFVKDGLRIGCVTRNTYHFHFKATEQNGIKLFLPDGTVKYVTEHTEEISNLTTTEGRNNALTNNFKGSGYSAAWYMGLVSNADFGAYDVGDTAAKITTSTPNPPTTNDWAESTGYSESTRPAITFGTASGGSLDSSAAPSTFTINTSVALNGGLVISNSTKGGTTGVLYGMGSFSTVVSLSSGVVTAYVTLGLANA